jgi:hypothetical protein
MIMKVFNTHHLADLCNEAPKVAHCGAQEEWIAYRRLIPLIQDQVGSDIDMVMQACEQYLLAWDSVLAAQSHEEPFDIVDPLVQAADTREKVLKDRYQQYIQQRL